jgi:hypothetical protein
MDGIEVGPPRAGRPWWPGALRIALTVALAAAVGIVASMVGSVRPEPALGVALLQWCEG